MVARSPRRPRRVSRACRAPYVAAFGGATVHGGGRRHGDRRAAVTGAAAFVALLALTAGFFGLGCLHRWLLRLCHLGGAVDLTGAGGLLGGLRLLHGLTGLTVLARFDATRLAPRAAAFFAAFLTVFFGAVLPDLRLAGGRLLPAGGPGRRRGALRAGGLCGSCLRGLTSGCRGLAGSLRACVLPFRHTPRLQ